MRLLFIVGLLVIAGCASLASEDLGALFGPAFPKEFVPVTNSAAPEFERDIRPIMERRCLVCHGCYDAPCQLKLDSYQGILRGASKERVYESTRLAPAAPSRLFEDAQTTAGWRSRGFHPVLNERRATAEANQASVFARSLDLKQRHPLPDDKILPSSFDLSLGHKEQCPSPEEFSAFAQKFPLWGMPYGLPALSAPEHRTLKAWLTAGAPAMEPAQLSAPLRQEMQYWETLFNGDSLKHRLAARYVYEHLFLAHVYLEDRGEDTVFFKLVRSRTPPGIEIDPISTRRPYDDPGVERVYYRLWRDPASIVAKTHMPYRLNAERRDRWRKWFIDTEYTVSALPSYEPDQASNPFLTFRDIPYASRHSFLLDEAQFTIMNFIKGPVCRGNVALDVIQDRFWVFFTTPQSAVGTEFAEFLSQQDRHLKLPAGSESGLSSAAHWRSYAKAQSAYLHAKGDFIRSNAKALESAGLNTFWDGDGRNDNAALTVFRHYDSATVIKGLVGTPPKTAWLIDYPILERIHYLLVAGFDVYGTAPHQVMTRLYMDFLRMESEMNFLGFLPQEARIAEVGDWYRDADESVADYLGAYFENDVLPSPVEYRTDRPKQELFDALRRRMGPVLERRHELGKSGLSANAVSALDRLNALRGLPASIMPQATLIKVEEHGNVTVLSDSAFTNISSMFGEASRRLPEEDGLTVANGVAATYPNVFLHVREADIPSLVSRIETLRTEVDYSALLDRYGVRRTDPRFWPISDQVLASYQSAEPLNYGVLDYNRYDNR